MLAAVIGRTLALQTQALYLFEDLGSSFLHAAGFIGQFIEFFVWAAQLAVEAVETTRQSAHPQVESEELDVSPHLSDLAGRVAESAAGYFFRSIIGLDVAHFPERGVEPEVDFVLTIGEQRIPVEVKYRRRIEHKDTVGLRSFVEKPHYNAPFGLLVTLLDEAGTKTRGLCHSRCPHCFCYVDTR